MFKTVLWGVVLCVNLYANAMEKSDASDRFRMMQENRTRVPDCFAQHANASKWKVGPKCGLAVYNVYGAWEERVQPKYVPIYLSKNTSNLDPKNIDKFTTEHVSAVMGEVIRNRLDNHEPRFSRISSVMIYYNNLAADIVFADENPKFTCHDFERIRKLVPEVARLDKSMKSKLAVLKSLKDVIPEEVALSKPILKRLDIHGEQVRQIKDFLDIIFLYPATFCRLTGRLEWKAREIFYLQQESGMPNSGSESVAETDEGQGELSETKNNVN